MTIDDLEELFDAAFRRHPNFRREGKRAGIAAVIRALRDEMCACQADDERSPITLDTHQLWQEFQAILGDAGAEKVAGGSTREDEKAVEAAGDKGPVTVNSPATDPAPAVCEWAWERPSVTSYYGWYRTSHGERTRNFSLGGKCIACGLPIKFTEAKT